MEKEVSRKKHRKRSRFWFGYRIYLIVLAVLLVIMWFAVWNTMKKYEAAQPDKVIDNIVNKIESGKINDLKIASSKKSKFEPDADPIAELKEKVNGRKLSYKLSTESYDSLAPIYDIMAEKEKIATVSLKSVKEYKKMAILVLSDWEISSVALAGKAANYAVTITVPENYEVTVNTIPLTAEEKTGDAKVMDGFEYVAEYVTPPKSVTYKVEGLINMPVITVNGRTVEESELDIKDGKITYNGGFDSEEIDSELRDYVLNAAKTYTNFFSKDLEGCRNSTAPIEGLFPAGSYYIQMAENYRQQDMWTYSAHQPPVFSNEEVKDYKVYSEDCFSVNVVFDKSMILKLNGQERVDHNDQIYYYVKIDGKWLIADMKEKV